MAKFNKNSLEKLKKLHPDLQQILLIAIKITDFSILDSLRDEQAQQKAVSNKRSKVDYPNSKHNRSKQNNGTYDNNKSDAFDIVPYPIQWPDIRKQTTRDYVKRMGRFYFLSGVIKAIAYSLNIKIKWGGDFKNFFDGPHYERIVK